MLTKINRGVFNLLLAAGLAGFLAGCKPPGPKALLDGERLLEKGKPAEAVARLRVATELMATNAQAWNYLGIAHHQAGDFTNAAHAYQRALSLDHDLMETRLNLGTLWLEQGRASEAKSEFTAYTLRRQNAPDGFRKLASAEMRLREFTLAETHARKAVQLDGANPESWNTLGLAQLQRGRTRDAAESFAAALQKQANFAPALLNLAVVSHQHLGDRAAAVKLYRQYVALTPAPANADAVRLTLRQLESELAPARPAFVTPAPPQVAAQPPARQPSVVSNVVKPSLASAAPTNKPEAGPAKPVAKPVQSAPAPRSAPSVVALVPEPVIRTEPEPVARMPKPAASSAKPQGSPVPAAEPVVVAEPKEKKGFLQSINPVNLFRREPKPQRLTPLPASGDVTPSASTTPEPVVVTESAVKSTSKSPASFPRYTSRGVVNIVPGDRAAAERFAAQGARALERKQYADATAAFRSAAAADPGWYQAHHNHAVAALEAGRTAEALSACEATLALKPDSSEARYNFALALKRGNYIPDAAAQLEQVLQANPNDARAHLALGNLYAEQLREPARAREHYLKVLQLEPRHPRAAAIGFWLRANPAK